MEKERENQGFKDESMVRKYIQEIKIYEDRFKVCFKAGIELDIPR